MGGEAGRGKLEASKATAEQQAVPVCAGGWLFTWLGGMCNSVSMYCWMFSRTISGMSGTL